MSFLNISSPEGRMLSNILSRWILLATCVVVFLVSGSVIERLDNLNLIGSQLVLLKMLVGGMLSLSVMAVLSVMYSIGFFDREGR